MNTKNSTDNLIVGAGLSGLSFAYFSKNPNYLIIEKESEPGGYCRTIKNPNYVWDFAGHFYHFTRDKYKKLFESLVEPEEIIRQTKNTKIFYKNQLIDYPFQTNIHQLEKEEFIDCLYDLFTKDSDAEYHDFLGMLYAKFGKSITEKFLRPYNEKLYATNLKNLDREAMGRFFPYADIESIIRNMKEAPVKTYNDTFLYLKKGTGYFIDKLYRKLDPSKIKLNTTVKQINPSEKSATLSDGSKIFYQKLINTTPFNHFIKLFGDEKLDKLSNSLSYNQVLVLNLGFDKTSPRFTKEHWVYFPDKNLNFYRVGFYNNILSQNKLSVYVEIGFNKTANIDPEAELKTALAGMKSVGVIDDNTKLVDKNFIIMNPAYVHISTKEDQQVRSIQTEFESKDIYNLGRYGKWTYNSMEDCMELADQLSQKF